MIIEDDNFSGEGDGDWACFFCISKLNQLNKQSAKQQTPDWKQ